MCGSVCHPRLLDPLARRQPAFPGLLCRASVLAGVEKLADAVQVTLGPKVGAACCWRLLVAHLRTGQGQLGPWCSPLGDLRAVEFSFVRVSSGPGWWLD
jgi:hypothetical protein